MKVLKKKNPDKINTDAFQYNFLQFAHPEIKETQYESRFETDIEPMIKFDFSKYA